MRKARISNSGEIVQAEDLIKLYPNYHSLVFMCIDEKCSVRMAPSCIKKNGNLKPHFKKYRNKDHIDTCEYATFDKLLIKGKTSQLNHSEIKKIGYPSVFNLNEDLEDEKTLLTNKLHTKDDGITRKGDGNKKLYIFDGNDTKFNRSNKVQSIDRIVDWYLGFPYNRTVELEINNTKIQYRYFFKKIDGNTDPNNLMKERIFYGKLILSDTNKDIFDKHIDKIYFKLLGHKPMNIINNTIENYFVILDKQNISKNLYSKIKNRYNELFQKAYIDFKNKSIRSSFGLYIFVYGNLDVNKNNFILSKKHHITFRYDEVRKTVIEE